MDWRNGDVSVEGNNPSNNHFLCPGVGHASIILAEHGPDSDPFFLEHSCRHWSVASLYLNVGVPIVVIRVLALRNPKQYSDVCAQRRYTST